MEIFLLMHIITIIIPHIDIAERRAHNSILKGSSPDRTGKENEHPAFLRGVRFLLVRITGLEPA